MVLFPVCKIIEIRESRYKNSPALPERDYP